MHLDLQIFHYVLLFLNLICFDMFVFIIIQLKTFYCDIFSLNKVLLRSVFQSL